MINELSEVKVCRNYARILSFGITIKHEYFFKQRLQKSIHEQRFR